MPDPETKTTKRPTLLDGAGLFKDGDYRGVEGLGAASPTTAEEIVRLLVEELGDPGRVKPIYDSWNTRVGEAYHLSNPLRHMAQEWVKHHER